MLGVVLVDDNEAFRDALETVLADTPGLTVLGASADSDAAVELVLALRPDAVVMDYRLQGNDGLETTRRILTRWPQARMVVYTSLRTQQLLDDAVRSGALDLVVKGINTDVLVRAIRRVAAPAADTER
jgi:NarL family two-component system response regulator LiaR